MSASKKIRSLRADIAGLRVALAEQRLETARLALRTGELSAELEDVMSHVLDGCRSEVVDRWRAWRALAAQVRRR